MTLPGLAVVLSLLASPLAAQGVAYVDADAPPPGDGRSWASAFPSLRDAIAAASVSGGYVEQIWIAEGVYRPAPPGASTRFSFDVLEGVSLYGGFEGTESSLEERDWTRHVTILSGDLQGRRRTWRRARRREPARQQRARADGRGHDDRDRDRRPRRTRRPCAGGGRRGRAAARARRPHDSQHDLPRQLGGRRRRGVFVDRATTIEDCQFEDNYAANGGALYSTFPMTIRRTAFRGNSAASWGGAVADWGGLAARRRERFPRKQGTPRRRGVDGPAGRVFCQLRLHRQPSSRAWRRGDGELDGVPDVRELPVRG